MKVRFLSTLLAIALLASLVACGNSAIPVASGKEQYKTGSTISEDGATYGTPEQSGESMGPFNVNATLAETVLVDEGGVKITATGLTYTA